MAAVNLVGIAMLLFMLLQAFAGLLPGLLAPQGGWQLYLLRAICVPLCYLAPTVLLRKGGIPRPRRHKGTALCGFWLMLPLFVAALLLAGLAAGMAPTAGVTVSALPRGVVNLVLYYLAVCLLPACMEEVFFRGCVLPLLHGFGRFGAVLLSTALFTLMHARLAEIPTVFLLGLLLGVTYEVCGAVWPGVLLHLFNNSLAFGLVLARDAVPEYTLQRLLFGLMVASLLGSTVSGWRFLRAPRRFLPPQGRGERLLQSSTWPFWACCGICIVYFSLRTGLLPALF